MEKFYFSVIFFFFILRVIFFLLLFHEVRDNVSTLEELYTLVDFMSSGVWKVEGESEVEGNIL